MLTGNHVSVGDRRDESSSDELAVLRARVAELEAQARVRDQWVSLMWDRSPLGQAALDGAGVVVRVNPALCRLLGYAPAELVGRGGQVFMADGQGSVADRGFVERLERGEIDAYESERVLQRGDGTTVPVVLSVSVERAPDGSVERCAVLVLDHSAHHRAQRDLEVAYAALRRSEARLRQVLDAGTDAYVVGDADGLPLHWNTACERLFGWSREEALSSGWRIRQLIMDAEQARAWLPLRERLLGAGDGRATVELQARHRDGTLLEVEATFWRVLDPDGRPQLHGLWRDIGPRKRAQAELEAAHAALVASEARLREVLDLAADAYLASDEQGLCVAWNAAAERLFGYRSDEVLGRRLADLLLDDGAREAYLPLRARMLGDGRELAQPRAFLGRHKDGSVVETEATYWRTGDDATGYRLHAFARETGVRNRQQAELAAARDEALAASRAKSAFLANTSHEIRTPLNGVLGMTDLLLAGELSPEQRERAELVRRSGQGLLAVLNDVLDLSKIEAGRLELEDTGFDLRRLVDDAVAPLRAAAAAKELDLVLSVDPAVPSAVRGDPGRLRQVLVNLLGNAVKFTESGSVRLTVDALREDSVWFAVSDTGVGISAEDQQRLFEPFAQADASTTRRYGGTGLGLAISRDLVGLLGGELLLSSAPDEGSTFSFSLPLPAAPLLAPPAPAAPPVAPAPSAPRGVRLLLAEDNPVNQAVAVGLLRGAGYDIDVVDDGQQALDRLAAEPDAYDALLLDCQMPVLDGYGTVEALRRREQDCGSRRLPVVALTANAMASDRERCLRSGMDEYLSKPFTPAALTAVLEELVRR